MTFLSCHFQSVGVHGCSKLSMRFTTTAPNPSRLEVDFPYAASASFVRILNLHYTQHFRQQLALIQNLRDLMENTPFLEAQGLKAVENMPRPGAIKTHLPFHRVPYSPQAKYIFVARNPYDCCVSFYHHTRAFPAYRFADGSFDEFLSLFLQGRVDYGDYFDQLLSWYNHVHDENVLFITYEKLKVDPSAAVIKIADFLGDKYGNKLRKQPEVLERILDTISVKTMMGLNVQLRRWTEEVAEMTALGGKCKPLNDEAADDLMKPMTGDFVRKAIVGDWKNHFSAEQIERMKERIALKIQESTVMSLWEDVELP
ncbi:sulfotransferase ssu-1-like isoform X2 [Dermacentor albipictus]|uniref:sulfotransferase ssu-1-like isoform X2 n=1 Tax=Dermacentor albipictus TaxID=60249 RepID=UPI0038FCB7A8